MKIKICCIASREEAQMAIKFGADALGLVGKMPSGPGPIEDDLIAFIAACIPPPVASFLLTSEQSALNIIEHAKRTGTNTVQIVDELTTGTYANIKLALPYLKLVQVIHVKDDKVLKKQCGFRRLLMRYCWTVVIPGRCLKRWVAQVIHTTGRLAGR